MSRPYQIPRYRVNNEDETVKKEISDVAILHLVGCVLCQVSEGWSVHLLRCYGSCDSKFLKIIRSIVVKIPSKLRDLKPICQIVLCFSGAIE